MQNQRKNLVSLSLISSSLVGAAAAFIFFSHTSAPLPPELAPPTSPVTLDLPMVPVEQAFPHVIEPRSTLFNALRDLNIPATTIDEIVRATKPVQNLAKLPGGVRFQTVFSKEAVPQLQELHFRFSAIESLKIVHENTGWVAHKLTETVTIETVTFSGTVNSSLWESAEAADMDPDLISALADIFGWEVDFSRAVRAGDRWRLTVEKKTVKGEPVGWGSILAAEYINDGESHQAALYRLNGDEVGYYNPNGESLRKMFLKSPLRYGRITSRFSLHRFHPKLQIYRPHQGVDYGTPVGTPVRAVGDGVVTFAQGAGDGGNVLKIRHNSVYQTAYKHLSGFAKGIHNGTRVKQGQVVAYSGNTGLSTGPHLHFEFWQNGTYVDPLSRRFPSADPVPKAQLADFKITAQKLLEALPAWEVAGAPTARAPSAAKTAF